MSALLASPLAIPGTASLVMCLGWAAKGFHDWRVRRRTDVDKLDRLDSYGYICCRPGTPRITRAGVPLGRCHVDETDQGPLPDEPCCDQGALVAPLPCPWHPPTTETP